jgi:lipopolysaccharide/colanic/teichoic acid biosynthesis glycosyltransferase
MRLYQKFGKRVFDMVLSLITLIIFLPIMILISLVQLLYFGSNIFFIQARNTKNSKQFKIIKFRTMTDTFDKSGLQLPDKYRITKFGKFLRATSLDEIPNLFNVLLGQMSIVGPRPLPISFYDSMSVEQQKRYQVRAGLTGLAQVSGRNKLTWKEKIDFDLIYVQNLNFYFDLKIIFKTLFILFSYNKNEALFDKGLDKYSPNFD